MSLCPIETVRAHSPHTTATRADSRDVHAKLRALLWMPVWFATSGLATGYFGLQDLIDCIVGIAAALAFAILTYEWCDADARIRNFAHWGNLVPALFLVPGPLVMVPVYLMMTRRSHSVRSITLAALYLFVLCALGAMSLILGVLLSGRDSPAELASL
jgi:hypothetical protein